MSSPNEAVYVAKDRLLYSTPRKVSAVAALIRGEGAVSAVNQLRLSSKKASESVLKVLYAAIHNAENNFDADVDSLYVSEVLVGKSITMKRFSARARGRGMRILKRRSSLVIKLRSKV